MNKILADFRAGKLGPITAVLSVIAIATTMFTYNGASIDAVTFLEKARATVFAIAGGSVIWLFWEYTIRIVPNLKGKWSRSGALGVAAAFCAMIFFISSSFNVTAFAGKAALDLHLSRFVGQLEETFADQYRQSLIIEGAASDIRMEAARYGEAAQREIKSGFYSGNPGPGAVVNALVMIQNRLLELEDEANTFLSEVDALNASVQTRLEKIRKIASSDKPLNRRMRVIAKESDALRSDFAQMDSHNLSESIARTLRALPGEVDMQTSFSANSATARRQKTALDKVRNELSRTSLALDEFMSVSSAEPVVRIAAFEKMTPGRAVQVYWKNFIPFWAGGIALDMAPLAIVLYLMIGLSSKTPAQLARMAQLNMTLEEIARGKLSEDALRRMGIDPDSLQSLNDDILGRGSDDKKSNDDDKGDE